MAEVKVRLFETKGRAGTYLAGQRGGVRYVVHELGGGAHELIIARTTPARGRAPRQAVGGMKRTRRAPRKGYGR